MLFYDNTPITLLSIFTTDDKSLIFGNTKHHILHDIKHISLRFSEEVEDMELDRHSFGCWWHGSGRTNHSSGTKGGDWNRPEMQHRQYKLYDGNEMDSLCNTAEMHSRRNSINPALLAPSAVFQEGVSNKRKICTICQYLIYFPLIFPLACCTSVHYNITYLTACP